MDTEFMKFGRTWWMSIIVIVGVTVLFAMNKITVDIWKEMLTWALTIAGGKSAIVGAATAIKK